MNYLPKIRQEEGGITRAVTDLCTVLAQRGHRVTLVTFDARDVPKDWSRQEPGKPHVVQLEASRLGTTLDRRSTRIVRRIIQGGDVLHLHAPWIPSNRQFARLARLCGKPYVVTAHGMLDDWSMARRRVKKRLYLALGGRRFLERSARVHCTAEAEKQQASKWFPQGTPVVLPLVFDLSPFQKLPGPEISRQAFAELRGDQPKILFLSRLHPKKGLEMLIDALWIVHQRGMPLKLLLAGPGEPAYCEKLKQRTAERHLTDHTFFLGMVRGVEKISLYEACDLFVLPTSQENFGLVLPEAMACRTPVITTRGVDIWQELEQGGAIIVDQSSEAIASVMMDLLSRPKELRQRGERGRQLIFDWLDPQKVVGQYEAMYAQVIEQAPSA